MANTIKIKRSTGETGTTIPTSLAEGELAYSESAGKLYYGDSNGDIKTIGGLASTFVPLGLPVASSAVSGGIKVGDNLSISSGVLSAASSYVLTAATNSAIGGMYTGTASGINLSTSGPTSGQIYLKIATQGEKGGVRLNSDTVQTVTANSVSATAGRTYSLQLANAGTGQAVVNVPWTDNNTTYTAGAGLTLTGTEFSADALAITTVQTAATQAAQLLLTAQEGDVVIRSDENKSYIHNGGSAGTMADYTLLSTPTSDITSITTSDSIDGGGTSGIIDIGHSTAAGHKHIPTGGSAGDALMWNSSGTAVWQEPNYTTNTDTTYDNLSDFTDDISATGGSDWSQTTHEGAAGKLVKRDSTGRIFVNEIWVGSNNSGSSLVEFYDDANNTARSFRWHNTNSRFEIEDDSGTMAAIIHANSTLDGGTY